jgi:hypothetical protein
MSVQTPIIVGFVSPYTQMSGSHFKLADYHSLLRLNSPLCNHSTLYSLLLTAPLTNYVLCHEDVWESGCIDASFLDVGTSQWVDRIMNRPRSPSTQREEVKILRSRGSSVSIAMGYGLCGPGSIPSIARFFSSPRSPGRLRGPPCLLYNGYRGAVSLGEKRPGREIDHSPLSSWHNVLLTRTTLPSTWIKPSEVTAGRTYGIRFPTGKPASGIPRSVLQYWRLWSQAKLATHLIYDDQHMQAPSGTRTRDPCVTAI